MKVRLWAKRLLQYLHLAAGLIEFCHDCGVRQPLVWHADNKLWDYVREPSHIGVLCPRCFDRRAVRKGLLLMWEPRSWEPAFPERTEPQ